MKHDYDYEHLDHLLMKKGWSWLQLAVNARLSPPTIYTVRDKEPTRPTMKKVAFALDVPIEDLIIEVDPTPAPEPTEE